MNDYGFQLGCDGLGNANRSHVISAHLQSTLTLRSTRRGFLAGAAIAGLSWVGKGRTALSDVVVGSTANGPKGDIFVVVFMRGGADGLNLMVPYGEDAYYRHRPNLGIPSPSDKRVMPERRALRADNRFAFHPMMSPMHKLFHEGKLGVVHACGSGDQTRSHFEAMSAMERGLPQQETGVASGWLARHLSVTQGSNSSPLRALALSSIMPDSLRGATDATAVNSLADFKVTMPNNSNPHDLRLALSDIYKSGNDPIAEAGRETLAVLDTLERVDPINYKPANAANYPASEFGKALRQVACLIKSKVGMEIACLNHQGPYLWDTHVAQETVFAAQAQDLATGIGAFVQDLGSDMKRVTLVAMTEFGRRLQENSGLGTDHGRGGVMFVTGGGVNGGKVHGGWPGLAEHQLEEPGDVKVVNDYRDYLGEILRVRLKNDNLTNVFPEYTPKPTGMVQS